MRLKTGAKSAPQNEVRDAHRGALLGMRLTNPIPLLSKIL
jgi:hypothetical protein